MKVEFNTLPPSAKVWIYAASAPLTDGQCDLLQKSGDTFTQQWTAHQMPLNASFIILHNLFLVFAVDVNQQDISGCGIDKQMHLVKQWENEFNLTLLNRLQIEYLHNNQVVVANKLQLLNKLQAAEINAETLVFNKTIASIAEYHTQFLIPLKNSWAYVSLKPQLT